ncbi:MAG TPA: HD domain-containing phosphohydrolase [Burkholderiaceae bacterium]|nr:HD domain-containing phosphohydrolase [Burkholderiaceae bacterium]
MSRFAAKRPDARADAPRTVPLHVPVSVLFTGLIVLVAAVLATVMYLRSARLLEDAGNDLAARGQRETLAALDRLLAPGGMAVRLFAQQANASGANGAMLGAYATALRANPSIEAFYTGTATGDFFLVRRLPEDSFGKYAAPPGTAFVVQEVTRANGASRATFRFLDAQLRLLGSEERADYAAFDPRERDWYRRALASSELVRTEPYAFFLRGVAGMTLAMRTADGGAVVGADIELATLAGVLRGQKITPATQLALFDAQGRVFGHEDVPRTLRREGDAMTLASLESLEGAPFARMAALAKEGATGGRLSRERSPGGDWALGVTRLELAGGSPVYLGAAIPYDELLAAARSASRDAVLTTLLVLLVAVPLAIATARAVAAPLRAHADRRREVEALAQTLRGTQDTIARFLALSSAIAAEEDFDRLMQQLLDGTAQATEAWGAVLLLPVEPEGALQVAARWQGGSLAGEAVTLSADRRPPLLDSAVLTGRAQGGTLRDDDVGALGLNVTEGAPVHAMVVPLQSRRGEQVGVLALLRDAPAEAPLLSFARALSGTAAIALETRELIAAQKRLFDAFIRLIADAIDAKSPYTGGHCARVPELTRWLAEAACAADDGPFREFALSERDWEAVRMGSWMHDCGKVTTPEYVVDKATKLETLYDRLHEVRMRFEVAKREAEVACWQRIAAGAPAEQEQAALALTWRGLDEDYAFVAACNDGDMPLGAAELERLRAIAARTWTRTLDDRLGLSWEELARKEGVALASLPAPEPMLADRPEHCIGRRPGDRMPADNPWGFKLDEPQLLYNRGELYNLSVRRGTLTAEERYKINDHIVQTIRMLSALPYPRHLRAVPEIAGGHHEKMDGTGYPRRLRRDQMSVVARMMAIADIFEALTARDRPYKRGKTLSESLAIMARMRDDKHIDAELFELFLRAGLPQRYAADFLAPAQADAIEIERYLAGASA